MLAVVVADVEGEPLAVQVKPSMRPGAGGRIFEPVL
jgi:hypothetical protein